VKITVFGLTLSSSWGNGHATPYRAIVRALDRLGHRVHFFEKDVPYYSSRRDFDSCNYCELTFYSAWAEVRERALSAAADSDVVITASFLPEGRHINEEILDLGRPLRPPGLEPSASRRQQTGRLGVIAGILCPERLPPHRPVSR